MHLQPHILLVILAAGILSTASPAQAIYIETPLHLRASAWEAEVGDAIELVITPDPENATATTGWAGKPVHIRYAYDQNEGRHDDPDTPTSNDGHTEVDIHRDLLLDDQARATLTWTVPAEVDSRNVHIFIETLDGERSGSARIAIGDATPMAHITSVDDDFDGDPEYDPAHRDLREDGTGGPATEPNEASAIGIVGLLAVIALAGAATLRSRRA